MDVGPAKVRRRSTKSVDTYSVTILLDKADYQTFYDFYDVDTNGGADTFYFNHPITGVSTEFRFTKPPEISPIGYSTFQVSMEWEVLPSYA